MPQQPPPYAVAGKEILLCTADARVTLLTLDPGQSIPPHRHSTVTDDTFCLSGTARLHIGDPPVFRTLAPGERATVPPDTVHGVANAGSVPVRLLLVQGPGTYDFLPA